MAVVLPNGPLERPFGYSKNHTDYVVDALISQEIASGIGIKWKWLGRSLGLEDGKLENIQASHRGIEETAYQMLMAWKETMSVKATVPVLADHLKELGRTDLANKITKMVADQPTIDAGSRNTTQTEAAGARSLPAIDCPDDAEVFHKVASSVGNNWKSLGREMGLEEHQLTTIEMNNRMYGREEIVFQMLHVWKETLSQKATIPLLAEHLREMGRVDLADEISKMIHNRKKHAISPQVPLMNETDSAPHFESSEIWTAIKSKLKVAHERLRISKIPWHNDWEMKFEDYYIDLTIKCKNACNTRSLPLREVFKSTEECISARNGFRSREVKRPTRILIEGPAGYGKSTLARKLCFDHAKNEDYIRHFDVVILLNLRDFQETLDEMIIDTLQLNDYNSDQILETINQNQLKTLFIVDDFDELNHEKRKHIIPFIKGNELSNSTVIVTSRLGFTELENNKPGSSDANLWCCMDITIIIEGIKEENRLRFLQLHLSTHTDVDAFKRLVDNTFHLFKKEERNLFNCPLFLHLLAIVSRETNIDLVTTKTELYKQLYNCMLRKIFVKDRTDQTLDFFDFDNDNPPAYVQMLSRFGSFAAEVLTRDLHSFTAEDLHAGWVSDKTILNLDVGYFDNDYPPVHVQMCSHFGSFVTEVLTRNVQSFTAEDLHAGCGSDNAILNLGVVNKSKSTIARTKKAWFKPLHLSFLEFLFAYSIWVSVICEQNFSPFFYTINIVQLLKQNKLVTPFLLGLSGKQLPSVLSVLINNHDSWLEAVCSFDYSELIAESKLTILELAKSFLPLFPAKGNICRFRGMLLDHGLLKETLKFAALRSETQRNIYDQQFIVTSEQLGSLPLAVMPDPKDSKHYLSQAWYNLITHQNIGIVRRLNEGCKFTLTMCEAYLNQQLSWLSNFIKIEGLSINRPIHEIEFWCSNSQLVGSFEKITDLIRKEKVISISFSTPKIDCTYHIDQWIEFIQCAKQSTQLLDMVLDIEADSLLTVDLGGKEGKKWRNIELIGDVVPRLGSQLCSLYELEIFMKKLPSRILTLRAEPRLLGFPSCVFLFNGDLSMAHTLCELRITISNSSSLESYIGENLKNLQVLAIQLSTVVSSNEQDIITSVLSMVSICRVLARLEFWGSLTEEFIANFLQRLREEKRSIIRNQEKSKKRNFYLDTLMLSPCTSNKKCILKNGSMKLSKELLVSGILQNLWLNYTEDEIWYASPEFIKSFSLSEDNTFMLEINPFDKNDRWQLNRLDDISRSMLVLKISVN